MWWGNLNVSCDEYLNAKCSAVLLVAADAAALPLQCLQKMTAEITRRGRLWPVQAQLFILCVLAVPYNWHAVLTGAQVVRVQDGQKKGENEKLISAALSTTRGVSEVVTCHSCRPCLASAFLAICSQCGKKISWQLTQTLRTFSTNIYKIQIKISRSIFNSNSK